MTQTTGRIFDEFARLMNDAAGVATGVRREAETVMRSQAERVLRELDVVTRDELDTVRDLASAAREENERLAARIAELETRLAKLEAGH
ncbi:accessory factor UbiK family protein [Starkeya sp. ORNL1]|jgi:BMFP domain-containing protein YqiC|uniref:accessory factor UbiK family protein n=1 Tax=Starkeya sp. ORNL1 TaxID=2709380 RepID=UPI0014644CB7|nr:accessory factor UbiK family protein [Starkeya sp. ORNL1]QJP17180.1 accessory factor UbiK family protein [Starkeya sp. ORNL1]